MIVKLACFGMEFETECDVEADRNVAFRFKLRSKISEFYYHQYCSKTMK